MRKWMSRSMPLLMMVGACAAPNQIIYEPPPPPPPAPTPDAAGNWGIATTREAPPEANLYCAPDRRLCVSLRNSHGWSLAVSERGGTPRVVATLPPAAEGAYYSIYGPVFAAADVTWLIGVERDR